jgi:hypothetical protein
MTHDFLVSHSWLKTLHAITFFSTISCFTPLYKASLAESKQPQCWTLPSGGIETTQGQGRKLPGWKLKLPFPAGIETSVQLHNVRLHDVIVT